MMRVLLSAFACDPHFGSDEEVGWRWALELCIQGHEVTVLTRASHRGAIEAELSGGMYEMRPEFVYIDLPRVHRILSKINRRNHLYYYLWQWVAYKKARALIREGRCFDLVHHVTWVSFRQPSFLGNLGIPFIFGPVAGGDEIPSSYVSCFSWRHRFIELVRAGLNILVRYDPLMRRTFRQADQLIFTSPGHIRRVPKSVHPKSRVELAIGTSKVMDSGRGLGNGTRLLYVGRAIGLKGMDIGLKVFARALTQNPELRLSIIGDGPERDRWHLLSRRLGIEYAVEWLGWLPKAKVQEIYESFDVLFYPSLRDSGGFVVLEALQSGLPVVCFKLGGPGVIIDDEVGAAVEANPDLDVAIEDYSQQLMSVLQRSKSDPMLAEACRSRAALYTWSALVRRVYEALPVSRVVS